MIELAKRLSVQHPVLYVNPPLNYKTYWREKRHPSEEWRSAMAVLNGSAPALRQENAQLWVLRPKLLLPSINWIPDGPWYDYLNKRNNLKYAKAIAKAVDHLAWQDLTLVNDGLMLEGFYTTEHLPVRNSFYLSRTNLVDQGYFARHGRRLERLLLAKVNGVLTSTEGLAERAQQYNAHTLCIGAGMDQDLALADSEETSPPGDWPAGSVVIGFIGALLSKRLDLAFMSEVITRAPSQWQWLFIGPLDEAFRRSNLVGRENCHFIGPRPPQELGQYIRHFSVAWHPLKNDPILSTNHPTKTFQYFQHGCPTVLKPTTTNQIFGDLAYYAESVEDTVRAFQQALMEEDPSKRGKRRDFTAAETWQACVDQLVDFTADAS